MNMMHRAEEYLNRQLSAFCSEVVTYIHYGKEPATLQVNAVPGRTVFRSEDSYGVVVRVHSVDFIISADALSGEPEKGDEIHCNGKRYEVLAPNNEPVWRWSGSGNTAMRIHTKEI